MPTASNWGQEFEGIAVLEQLPDDIVLALDESLSARHWSHALALTRALSDSHAQIRPEATELAACVKLLADHAPLAALVRLAFSPHAPFGGVDLRAIASLTAALVDELSKREGPEWTALARAQVDDPDDPRATEALDELDELEAGEPGSIEALESYLFDLASEAKDAGWYGLSAWIASRQAELDLDEQTIRQFGRATLDMRPDVPLTHGLWVRTLLNLEDEAGAAEVFRAALDAHDDEPSWVWALVRAASADGDLPELHDRAYAKLQDAFADDRSMLQAISDHREQIARDLGAKPELTSMLVLPARQRAAGAARVAVDVFLGDGPVQDVREFVGKKVGIGTGAASEGADTVRGWLAVGTVVFFGIVLALFWLLSL